MNGKILAVSGIGVAAVAVMTGAVLYLAHDLSVAYECQVDFLYEFDRPFRDVPGRGTLNADESNRNARYEDIMAGFKREVPWYSSRDGVVRCQQDLALRGEPESRIKAVLSSVRLGVVEMPSTNFVYSCRLVLSDSDSRNLDEYARFCMDRIKLQVEEENRLSIARVTIKECQTLKKAERKIEELKNAAAKKDVSSAEDELSQAMQTAEMMRRKIEEVRELVTSSGGRRIIYESQPEISWILRRKSNK